jgi:hypothetical protein
MSQETDIGVSYKILIFDKAFVRNCKFTKRKIFPYGKLELEGRAIWYSFGSVCCILCPVDLKGWALSHAGMHNATFPSSELPYFR